MLKMPSGAQTVRKIDSQEMPLKPQGTLLPHSFSPDTQRRESREKDIKVAIARGLHLFPFRTEKLNLATPMILRKWKSR